MVEATRLPNALIIGAAKAGTTALVRRLQQHPEVFVSRKKEPEFFSHEEQWSRGWGWYEQLFAGGESAAVRVEASTAYTRWPEQPAAADRIAEALPEARLIYLVRDPVARAYSHYVHRVTKELYPGRPVPVDFDEHVASDTMCINSSRYMDQIERYLAHFDRSALLVVAHERLVREPARVLSQVCAFLGIADRGEAMARAGTYRRGRDELEAQARAGVVEALRRVPGVYGASRLVPGRARAAAYGWLGRLPAVARRGGGGGGPP
ncbi:MAG: sulfotransferase, partial [Phycisphaeraceae bacterium]